MAGENAALKAEAAAKASGISMDEFMNKAHPCLGVNRIVDADAGEIEMLCPDGSPRKKIACVGFASSTKDMAPFNDPEWAICGMNQIYRHVFHKGVDGKPVLRHPDLHYEIHKEWNTAVVPGTDHAAWLRDCEIPILMTDRVAGLPTSVRFPIERLIQRFDIDYFTSTVAYMLAFTMDYIDRRVETRLKASPPNGLATAWDVMQLASSMYAEYTIGVFGIDLIVGEEYCVAPETEVLAADLRWMPASSVKIGDDLVGFDEGTQPGTGGRRWRRAVVNAATRVTRPCYRIKLADGNELTSSAEHRWLVGSGTNFRWRRTDQLVKRCNQYGSRLVKLVDPWGEPVHSWDAGYLAAAFDGEGHLCGQSGRAGTMGMLGYSQKDNAMAETVERALDAYGFAYRKKDAGSVNQYSVHGGRTEILRFLGQMRPQRLLRKFDPEKLGRVHVKALVPIESIKYIGERETVGLGTSTGTFVADGYASHNSWQKPCAEYWCGQIMARNITLMIPKQSALLKARYRYGYEMAPSDLINDVDISKRAAYLTQEHQKHSEAVVQLIGAIRELETMKELYHLRERGGTVGL